MRDITSYRNCIGISSIRIQAIRSSPLALTLPYLAFTPVFVALTGLLVLGERIPPRGLAGIGLVVLGAWMLNLDALKRVCRPLVVEL